MRLPHPSPALRARRRLPTAAGILAASLWLVAAGVQAQPEIGIDDLGMAPLDAPGLAADDDEADPPEAPAAPEPGAAVSAGSQGPALELEEFELSEERVVTATRFVQKVGEAPAIVQIFRSEKFREWGIETVSDALRLLAGVYTRPTRTSQWTAYFRGTLTSDNNKFLLLVDGVAWRDGVYGWAWIDRYVTLANVRQIEIIRGPGSALYGSNAFAGVINVITKRGEDLAGVRAGMSFGSYERRETWVNGGDVVDTPLGRMSVAAYARYFSEAGDGPPFSTQGARRIGAEDPHQAGSAGFTLNLAGFTLKWDVVDYRHARMDGGVTTFRDVVAQNPGLFNYSYLNNFVDLRHDTDLPLGLHLQTRLLYQDHQNSSSYVKCTLAERVQELSADAPAFVGGCTPDYKGQEQYEVVVEPIKDTRRTGLGLELQHAFEESNRAVMGFEWEAEQIREVVDAGYVGGVYVPDLEQYKISHTPLSIHDLALYLQDTLRPFPSLGLGLTLGARLGHHRIPRWNAATKDFDIETFNHFSPRAGVVYSGSERWTVKLLYGQAYRAPTARELLLESYGDWAGGDPTLKPELIRTFEGELTLRPLRWLTFTTSGYMNVVDDEIIEEQTQYGRSKGFRVYGSDSELRAQLKGLEAMINYSYTDALDSTEDLPQYGIPRHMGNALLGLHFGQGFSATGLVHYVGSRPRAEWHVAEMPDGDPYTLVDLNLRAAQLLGGRLDLTFSVRNLVGQRVKYMLTKDRRTKDYYTTDYELEGRSFMVHLEGKLL